MAQEVFAVAFWFLLAIVLVAVFLVVRQFRAVRELRRTAASAQSALRARAEEEQHLVGNRLPALVEALAHRPVEVPPPIHPDVAWVHERLMALVAEAVQGEATRGEQSAKSTLRSMMRAVLSLANEQQVAISAMQDQHDDPEVLAGLLRVDHMNSQLGRRAQATAVLCGSWPGQQRAASSLTDVVRGATSRIRDYLRVNIPTESDVAVVSRVVEPVVLAVAELLDNGARHSQPNTTVEVNFQQGHNGTAIIVDDAGVGMTVEELQYAATLLTGDGADDINRLGDPPRVGFAVSGVLAKRYGFRVSVDTRSPYGGVRAVLFLPSELLTRVSKPLLPTSAVVPPQEHPAEREHGDAAPVDRTPNGLPKRQRRTPAVKQSEPATEPVAAVSAPAAARPAERTASGLGAWQRGTRSGRVTPSAPEGNAPA